MTEKTWRTMTSDERLELLAEGLPQGERPAVMARVRAYLEARPRRAEDFFFCANVMLREGYREQHGATAQWDSAAIASGSWP